jgi:hypothetical protein
MVWDHLSWGAKMVWDHLSWEAKMVTMSICSDEFIILSRTAARRLDISVPLP